jgi:hypothetical protein
VLDTVAQLGLLAQGSDSDNWTNLLILLVMGAIWLVGALAKTLSNKRPAQGNRQGDPSGQPPRPRETWQERLARKVEEIQRTAETRSDEMARRLEQKTGLPAGGTQPPRAPTPGGKVVVRQGPRGESIMVYERSEPQPAAPPEPQPPRPRPARRPQAGTARTPANEPLSPHVKIAGPVKPVMAPLPSVTLEPAELPQPGLVKKTPARAAPDPEPQAILDYDDPDALRRAILHYEILGKPLAFRDLFE